MNQNWTESVFFALVDAGALYSLPGDKQETLFLRIQKGFPNKTEHDLHSAQQTIKECLDFAYSLGEQIWQKNLERSHAIEILSQKFPGFSDSFYADVLGQGLHDAMK